MQWLIHEVFSPALFFADTLAGGDPNAIVAVLLGRDEDRAFLRFQEGLKRADRELQTLPPDVADEVRALQRIVNGSIGTISIDDGWTYYANSDLGAAGKRGWSAVLRHTKKVPFPAAEGESNEGNAGDLIERLLAGPEDAELTPKEMARLEAYLKSPPGFSWFGNQREIRRTGCSEAWDRMRKLQRIRDFNRNLQAGAAVPTTTAPGTPALAQGGGNADSQSPRSDDREHKLLTFLQELTAYEKAARNARQLEFFPLEAGHPLYDAVESLGALPSPEPLGTWLTLRDRSRPCRTVTGWRNRQKDILLTDIPTLRAWGEGELTKCRTNPADSVKSGQGEGRDVSKVFISYSHDADEHCERVLQLANALRSHGVAAELDRYHVRPPEGWPQWCERQLRPEVSKFVLMICTETYRDRVENRVHADEGRGVFWEGGIIYSYIYDAKGNTRFIPVLLPGATEDCIPVPIRNHTRYQVERFDLAHAGYQALYRELTEQPAVTKPPLGQVVSLGLHPAAAAPLDPRPVETTFPTFAPSHEAPRSPQGETAATQVGEIQRLQRKARAASSWIDTEAWAIRKLIDEYRAIGRFREMLLQWGNDSNERDEEHKVWLERRKNHFERVVEREERLRTRPSAAQPNEVLRESELNWVWDQYYKEDRTGWLEAWVPPDLASASEPDTSPPLPLRTDRVLNLAERYATLAAIHDRRTRGVEKVNPWSDATDATCQSDRRRWLASLSYTLLQVEVDALTEQDRDAIAAIRRSVEDDLSSP